MRQRMFGVIISRKNTILMGLSICACGIAPHDLRAQQQASRFVVGPSQSKESSPLDRKVTIQLRDVPLGKALEVVDTKAELGLVYSPRLLPLDRKVSIDKQNASVRAVLEELLRGTGIVVRLSPGGRVMLAAQDTTDHAVQGGAVSGRVLDSAGNGALVGVTVTIRGAGLSMVTDANGGFVFQNVPPGEHVLEFKFLGYVSATRTMTVVKDKPLILADIRMRPSPTMLSGVVTTATGEQKKLEVGNSIVSLNVDSVMKVAPVTTVTDLLESRVPGMTIQRTSGTPGDPARIRLRGTNSISQNNDPIIIVDGMRMYSETSEERNQNTGAVGTYAKPSPLDQIDPHAIERIEVLKGPSASALYGSDAANGVIIITMKRGKAGSTRWRLAGDYGLAYFPGDWPTTWFKFVSNPNGGASRPCWGYCGDFLVDSLVPFQALNDSRSTALGMGSFTRGSVSVNGGSQNTLYDLTISTRSNLGVLRLPKVDRDAYLFKHDVAAPGWAVRPDRLENRSATLRVDLSPSENTRVGITTGVTQQTQRRTSMSQQMNGAISQLQEQYVDFSVYRSTPLLGNPYERVTDGSVTLRSGLDLGVKPFHWLPLTVSTGFSTVLQSAESKLDRDMVLGDLANGAWQGTNNNSTDVTGNINTTIPVARQLGLALGANFVRSTTNDQFGSFRGFVAGVDDPAQGTIAGETQFRRSTSERKSIGWFLEPRFNMQSRLFILPGFRLDNNGLRGKNAGFNSLPKINLSWIVSDEPFFPVRDKIRLLRVRTAFGVAGVQPKPGQGSRLFTFNSYNPYNNAFSDYGDILLLSHLGNPLLRPERGVEFEGGFEIELWDGRLSLDVTHARNNRRNAIISTDYSPSANGGGKSIIRGGGNWDNGQQYVNLGDIQTNNTEIVFNTRLIERRAIGLHIGGNLTRRRSEILRLRHDGSGFTGNGDLRYEVGYPMEAVWARPIIGYVDIDGDGLISPYEVSRGDSTVYVGSTEPSFLLNTNQNLSILNGRIIFNAVWSYTDGVLQTRAWDGNSKGNLAINAPNTDLGSMAGWVVGERYGTQKDQIGRMMVVDVLRLASFSMSLNLGPNVAKMFRAKNATIAVHGKNLGIWTNYVGVDPNVNAYSTGNLTADTGTLPQPREWTVSASIGW